MVTVRSLANGSNTYFSARNHYVPQWYQRRFMLPDQKEKTLHYLDLTPDCVARKNGGYYYREACRRLGTRDCFKDDHLYTLFLNGLPTDVIEKRFFGRLDAEGAEAVEFFHEYALNDRTEGALNALLRYMDAQRLRTPKGLDYIKTFLGRVAHLPRTELHQHALGLMRRLWQGSHTIWMEGVWEILRCDDSPTKFIVTDHPVCTYNKGMFPGSHECRYPYDAPIKRIGTHTVFPLDLNRCLVITNLEWVRNPGANPIRVRENPRYFEGTMFDMRKVQRGRQISEQDVLGINFVLKKRARRYLAAAKEEWLFPEEHLENDRWDRLGRKWFLMPDPRKVSFTTSFLMGFKDGRAWGQDEYGRSPGDKDPRIKAKRDNEWKTFQAFKKAWDREFGELDVEEWKSYM